MKSQARVWIGISCALCAALFSACSGSDGARGPAGTIALVNTANEPAGGNCDAGGVRITAGLDSNGDGKLSDDEVTSTEYVCNGVNGDAGTPGESGRDGDDGPPGDTGAPGPAGPKGDPGDAGPKGATGATGDAGPKGATGATGDAGPKGDPGDAGANGLNSLVSIDPEPNGSNCAFGGVRISAGLDTNRNGTLDSDEVTQTRYVCNGAPGASGSGGATSSDAGSGGAGSGGDETSASGSEDAQPAG